MCVFFFSFNNCIYFSKFILDTIYCKIYKNKVISYLLKNGIWFQLYLHGNNLSTLHEYLPIDILPTELGGEGPPFNPLPWAEKLMNIATEGSLDDEINRRMR